jgi:hypothetical protein
MTKSVSRKLMDFLFGSMFSSLKKKKEKDEKRSK